MREKLYIWHAQRGEDDNNPCVIWYSKWPWTKKLLLRMAFYIVAIKRQGVVGDAQNGGREMKNLL